MIAHAQHFATKVTERRRKLGMTFLDVNHNGGPSAPTVAKAEAGELDDPRPSTLSKFDAGLRWLPGSAAGAYWDGDDPKPREGAGRQTVLAPTSGTVALPLDQILGLMTAQGQLHDVIDRRQDESIPADEIRPIARALDHHISVVVGTFVTDMLERNHKSHNDATLPLLQYAFAELLAPPVSDDDPARSEKLYRRWLLGNIDPLDDTLVTDFRRRLRRRTKQREEGAT
ncbi:hypothetical protein ABIA30_004038 [Mycobacterium sp. MAA66]|uniref:hypothetical protein n=1 Tax=Mycobacterium sp. MAA66 TaxID=3156297 RepID=UPI003514EED5